MRKIINHKYLIGAELGEMSQNWSTGRNNGIITQANIGV